MAVAVCGPSGIGKSALVRRFLGELVRRDEVVVLAGRCYENESVPYKALDGVVDDLSRYLGSIPLEHALGLLPPDVSALTRVFPVLLQVDAVAGACRRPGIRERRSSTCPASSVRGVGGAPPPARDPTVARRLDRRSSVGRCGQHGPPRGDTGPAEPAGDAHAAVLQERGDCRQAVSPGLARSSGPARVVGTLARADDGRRSTDARRRPASRRLHAHRPGQAAADARGGRQPVRSGAAGPPHGRHRPGDEPAAHLRGDVRRATQCPPAGRARLPRDPGHLRSADGARGRLRCLRDCA